MASVAQLKLDLEKDGYEVLLLDAGDAIQDNNLVNFSQGQSAIHFMNACGYDAATLGNHEFDYGQDVLADRVSEACFPYVSCNVFVDATGTRLVKPHVILQRCGAKIGIFGITTPETIVSTSPKNIQGLRFVGGEELYELVQQEIDELKADGCELIIALGHLGSSKDSIGYRSEDILENTKGIDIFIDGHDHLVKNLMVNGGLLVETGCHTDNIGRIVYENGQWHERLIRFGDYNKPNKKVDKLIKDTAAYVSEQYKKKVGYTAFNLNGQRFPGVRNMETNLGDFIADAYLWQARKAMVFDTPPDIAIVNGGSLRKGIPAGDITIEDIIGVVPYNEQLYVVKIKGADLLEALESATCINPDAMGAFPQVSGISFTLDTTVPYQKGEAYPDSVYFEPAKPGSRVHIDNINGKPFSPEAEYQIAVIEFITLGGDAYSVFTRDGVQIAKHSIGYTDEKSIENYLAEELGGIIDERYAESQNRINIIK